MSSTSSSPSPKFMVLPYDRTIGRKYKCAVQLDEFNLKTIKIEGSAGTEGFYPGKAHLSI